MNQRTVIGGLGIVLLAAVAAGGVFYSPLFERKPDAVPAPPTAGGLAPSIGLQQVAPALLPSQVGGAESPAPQAGYETPPVAAADAGAETAQPAPLPRAQPPAPVPEAKPEREDVAPPPTEVAAVAPPAPTETAPPAAAPLPGPRIAPEAVDSFAPADQRPLTDWTVNKGATVGAFDAVAVEGTGRPVEPDTPIDPAERLLLYGWAGEYGVGIPFDDVVISLCGKVVGHARVGEKRADVAKAVHPNLLNSGWRARLFAGHLAPCSGAALEAWAVTRGDAGIIMPLKGRFPISLAPLDSPLAPPGMVSATPFGPEDLAPIDIQDLRVTATRLNIRRCGDRACKVVGKIEKGVYPGYIAAEKDGWALILFGDKAGWVARRYIRPAE